MPRLTEIEFLSAVTRKMYNEDYKLWRLLQNFAPNLFDFFTHKSRYSDQHFILNPFELFLSNLI